MRLSRHDQNYWHNPTMERQRFYARVALLPVGSNHTRQRYQWKLGVSLQN